MKLSEDQSATRQEQHTSTGLLFLYAANSFLFLLLSFFFLPDSIVKIAGSAVGVALGVLGLKSVNPRENEGVTRWSRYRSWFVAILLLAALGQMGLLYLGFANPCRIWAIPGSTVFVDGKFLERTPDPPDEILKQTTRLESPNNILPWLTPLLNKHWLRWDTHEIKIAKKWYVDAERSQESVRNVSVNIWKLWNPRNAFDKWEMKTEQRAYFKIDYGFLGAQPEATPPSTGYGTGDFTFNEPAFRNLAEEWDQTWTTAMDQKDVIGHKRTELYVAAIQMVQDRSVLHLEFQIRDWTDRPLKPLRPIPQPRAQSVVGSNQVSDPRIAIREEVFDQLLKELGIPEKIKVPRAANEVIALAQQLNTAVETSAAPPAEGPPPSTGASPSPPAIVTTVKQLEKIATDAVKNNQMDVAVAAQQQLKETITQVSAKSSSSRTLSFKSDLEEAQKIVQRAIGEKTGKGRVYIHIVDESQRDPARKLESLLNAKHFVVVGIQNVGGRAYIPDTAEVRFFAYPEPATTKQAANEIVQVLESADVQKARPSYVIPSDRDRQQSSDITTHFEIWLAKDSFQRKSAY
jgi:hypothetical protein